MGQANKRGTFSQRLDAAHRKAADEIEAIADMKQHIAKLEEIEIQSTKQAEYIAKQLIIEHWKRSDISHRAAFSSEPVVWS